MQENQVPNRPNRQQIEVAVGRPRFGRSVIDSPQAKWAYHIIKRVAKSRWMTTEDLVV